MKKNHGQCYKSHFVICYNCMYSIFIKHWIKYKKWMAKNKMKIVIINNKSWDIKEKNQC